MPRFVIGLYFSLSRFPRPFTRLHRPLEKLCDPPLQHKKSPKGSYYSGSQRPGFGAFVRCPHRIQIRRRHRRCDVRFFVLKETAKKPVQHRFRGGSMVHWAMVVAVEPSLLRSSCVCGHSQALCSAHSLMQALCRVFAHSFVLTARPAHCCRNYGVRYIQLRHTAARQENGDRGLIGLAPRWAPNWVKVVPWRLVGTCVGSSCPLKAMPRPPGTDV